MKPTLVILAAGMGSRFGGLKQIDAFGPNGETIIDYSIFDAIRSGYGKIVFIIRKHFEKEFNDIIIDKVRKHINVDYVFQELDYLPEGYVLPPEREKPWGTGHAVLCVRNIVNEPFTVINGDDFYGFGAFKVMSDYLSNLTDSQQNIFSMVAYKVGNTLSENGVVSRGVCNVSSDDTLISVTERTNIKDYDGIIGYIDENENMVALDFDSKVSMNFWGFTPLYFDLTHSLFIDFLDKNINTPKSEFYIPSAVDLLIKSNKASVKVLTSDAKWFGVTYKEDKPSVVNKIGELVDNKIYPSKLF